MTVLLGSPWTGSSHLSGQPMPSLAALSETTAVFPWIPLFSGRCLSLPDGHMASEASGASSPSEGNLPPGSLVLKLPLLVWTPSSTRPYRKPNPPNPLF